MVYFREALYALVLLAFVLQDAVHGLRIGTSSKMSIRAQRQTLMMSAENIAVLRQAAFTRDVDRRDVIDNIRQLDTQSEKVKIDPTSVKGKWELVFSSIPGGAANGFLIGGFFDGYFSIKEIVDFFECSLKTAVGSFRGPPSELKSTVMLVVTPSFHHPCSISHYITISYRIIPTTRPRWRLNSCTQRSRLDRYPHRKCPPTCVATVSSMSTMTSPSQ